MNELPVKSSGFQLFLRWLQGESKDHTSMTRCSRKGDSRDMIGYLNIKQIDFYRSALHAKPEKLAFSQGSNGGGYTMLKAPSAFHVQSFFSAKDTTGPLMWAWVEAAYFERRKELA